MVKLWADMIGCGIETIPFKYLGLLMGSVMSRLNSWSPVLDKFRSRLTGWKTRTISFGGLL